MYYNSVMNISQINDQHDAALVLAQQINSRLNYGDKVVWFVSGGSCVDVAVAARKLINASENLWVCLVDERFVPAGHENSNSKQLLDAGFDTEKLQYHAVLTTKDIDNTTLDYNQLVGDLLVEADYSIGLFGIGTDGHTAGLLPDNSIMKSTKYYDSYKAMDYQRISATPLLLRRMNEAMIYAVGENKTGALREFLSVGEVEAIPARLLKSVDKLTVLTDINESELV